MLLPRKTLELTTVVMTLILNLILDLIAQTVKKFSIHFAPTSQNTRTDSLILDVALAIGMASFFCFEKWQKKIEWKARPER